MRLHPLAYSDAVLCVELELAGGCSLDESPGSNWVQKGGGLPNYICRIARAIKRTGKSTSAAIAIAISRIKAWIADPNTDPDTKAKSVAALAQWEKLKGKSHLKNSAGHDELLLKLTGHSGPYEGVVNLAFDDAVMDKLIALTAVIEADVPCRDAVQRVIALAKL